MNTEHDKVFKDLRKRALQQDKRARHQAQEKAQFQDTLQDTLRALKQVTQLSEAELAELAKQAISRHRARKTRLRRWLLGILFLTAAGAGGYSLYHRPVPQPMAALPQLAQVMPAPVYQNPMPLPSVSSMPAKPKVTPTASAPPRYKKAQTTRGDYLNPGKEIPANAFRVFYLNTNNPKQIIASEIVNDIAIHYAYDKFNGIPSQDFGAYWVGMFDVPDAENREINISQSWSDARLMIDGNIVYEGPDNKRITYPFSKGPHLIEVEYNNNWHTTKFLIEFNGAGVYQNPAEIQGMLQHIGEANVYFADLYESESQDMSVNVDLEKSEKPVVLFLSSYNAVKWVIRNLFQVNIKAIVYGSYLPGSQVSGEFSNNTLILIQAGRIARNNVKSLTGQPLSGITEKYAASSIRMPEVYLAAEKTYAVNGKAEE